MLLTPQPSTHRHYKAQEHHFTLEYLVSDQLCHPRFCYDLRIFQVFSSDDPKENISKTNVRVQSVQLLPDIGITMPNKIKVISQIKEDIKQ